MLSEQEAAEVHAYARQYPEVQQAIDSYEASLEQYARLHAVQPPAALQEKIWHRLQAGSRPVTMISGRKIWRHPVLPYLMAACVILLIGSVVLNVMFYTQYKHVQEQTERLQAQQADLQQQLSQYATALQVLRTPDYTPVLLKGVAQHPNMIATVYWNPSSGEFIYCPICCHPLLPASNISSGPLSMVSPYRPVFILPRLPACPCRRWRSSSSPCRPSLLRSKKKAAALRLRYLPCM